MQAPDFRVRLKLAPALDPDFIPASMYNRVFSRRVLESGRGIPFAVALERNDGLISIYKTKIFEEGIGLDDENCFYAERLVKTLLWARGGWKLTIGGSAVVGDFVKRTYAPGGKRQFDADFMSRVYEKPFTVDIVDFDKIPEEKEGSLKAAGNLDGCRIGFDAGGSDRKVSAVIDGETVYSEEVIWHPKLNSDPEYHYQGILESMKSAASHMPRVDAIGVSSAGIYMNNRTMVASLFIKVPDDLFEARVKDIYLNVAREMGDVPIAVANDGDVTALAGAMNLGDGNVLGIAMGTSEAGGYADKNGNVTGWLNELAFVPVDYNKAAAIDEWSGDYGCGVKYFSQDAVIKLAPAAGIILDEGLTPAEKLKAVQDLLKQGDRRARLVFESIGRYLGYAIAHYSDFYDIRHILILGRVTSGEGGNIVLSEARKVLDEEFGELSAKLAVHLPDESNRRVGQSIAAASLPVIRAAAEGK